ncbi:MAG: hypothetical protein HUU49_01640 [Candidatus Buchananbacteria bacterium]|nr:hypothetical protein [Candidatus Buchananbacteria bacterium]
MVNNLAASAFKYIIIDLIGDILYWPIWWYSKGLLKATKASINAIINQERSLGLGIWVKNIFTPMFGQYDIEGRIISFFARLIQIIVRSIILFVWAVVVLLFYLFWLILPVIVVYEIYYNILGLFA